MPGYTWTEPDLQRRGPVITVSIAATAAAEAAAKAAGSEIPDPVTVPALVDTGAGAILGRDVLAHAIFVYVGYAGQCTIAF